MTDKQLIETLKNIKKCCDEHRKINTCKGCQFHINKPTSRKNGACHLTWLNIQLCYTPDQWDMKKIEEIIND